MVPVLLLLVARDLLLHDPPRVLAWRVLHDPRLQALPAWLQPLLPRPPVDLDRDPLALLLGALAAALAVAYLAAAAAGARPALRGALLAVAATALVAVPSAALMALGAATERPYGQDGGVVQLPLALDKILAGESPYGADYSDSILGKEARRSEFWAPYGGNPILRHHAYLPGTHLVMLPFHLAGRRLGFFDPRLVTLLAWAAAALLAARLAAGAAAGLTAAAAVLVSPLVYWHQIFGANDVLAAAWLLLAVRLARGGGGEPAPDRRGALAAGVALGLACATKQLAWPYAPFLLALLSGARDLRGLASAAALRRLAAPALATAATFAAVVAPVAALDWRRFWGDVVAYNVGLAGAEAYPLGGTPGFGAANLLLYFGRVSSLHEHVAFGRAYLLLIPLGLLLLRHQLRQGDAASVLVTGSAALAASLYLSRVVHPNYLVPVAVLLPAGFLMGARRPPDVAVVPLLLLAAAAEVSGGELFRAVWEDAAAVRLPQHLAGVAAALAPRAGPHLSLDPIGLGVSAAAAGLAILFLCAGVLGAGPRVRLGLALAGIVAVTVVPLRIVTAVEAASGTARVQDPWRAAVGAEARRHGAGWPAGRAVEAWSNSFRRDPPAPLATTAPAPPVRAAGWLLGRLRVVRPHGLVLAALCAAGLLLARLARPELRPLALGLLLLPPASIDLVFGSGDVVLLCLLLAAWAVARREARGARAAGLIGVAAALFPWTAPALGAVARPGRRGLAAAAAGFACAWLPVRAAEALLAGVKGGASAPLQPALGLPNVFLYWGAGEPRFAEALSWLVPAAALGTLLWAARRLPAAAPARAALAGAGMLAALWSEAAGSATALLAPAACLALAGLLPASSDDAGADPGAARRRAAPSHAS